MKALLLTFFAVLSVQAEPLPLANGNSWTYREAKTGVEFQIRVSQPAYIDGREYHSLSGYVSERLWVRYDEHGSLVWWNGEREQDETLLSLEEARGAWWQAPFRPCDQEGQRQNEPGRFEGGAGRYGTVDVRYRSFGCADEGVELEQFAENIGMLRRVKSSIAGPRHFDLVRARVGKRVIEALPAGNFTVSAASVEGRDYLEVFLRLASNSLEEVTLRFPSAQEYDILLRDSNGAVVYTWSEGLVFAPAEHTTVFYGDWLQRVNVPRPKAGRYTLEAWMTTAERPVFAAAVGITIP